MFGSLGFPEILLILVIVILIFGSSRIPELGRGLGEGIRNFKKSIRGEEPEDDKKKVRHQARSRVRRPPEPERCPRRRGGLDEEVGSRLA